MDAETSWLFDAPPWAGRNRTATETLGADTNEEALDISVAEVTLGKLASENALLVRRRGWPWAVLEARGESNLSREVHRLPHKKARLLSHSKKRGAGVLTTTLPWALQRRKDAVRQGAHQSAHRDRAFVFEEMLDFCQQGY